MNWDLWLQRLDKLKVEETHLLNGHKVPLPPKKLMLTTEPRMINII